MKKRQKSLVELAFQSTINFTDIPHHEFQEYQFHFLQYLQFDFFIQTATIHTYFRSIVVAAFSQSLLGKFRNS